MTTPLTYSFARLGYQEVFKVLVHFGCFAGDNPGQSRSLCQHDRADQRRIYYNGSNVSRAGITPGFKANRHFMER